MDSDGRFAPDSVAAARERYTDLASTARQVVRETARAMDFDREEYRDRVDGAVVATARDALFAAELEVRVGTREEFDAWCDSFDGEVHVAGNEHVDNVTWHAFDGEAVAATFQNEPEAAVSTLRRQAFGRLYREHFYEEREPPEVTEE
jgi:predicted GNAT superfamily acetyltransferase